MRRLALAAALLLGLVLAAPVHAAGSGGASLPSAGGGTEVGQAAPEAPRPQSPRPVLRAFSVSGSRVRFRIDAPARRIRVRLVLRRPHTRRATATIRLGPRATKRLHAVRLKTSRIPRGRYVLTISARDGRGRALRSARGVRAARRLTVTRPRPRAFRFPLVGPFSYGGPGARFGAPRPGHVHQGQDIIAPAGTPVVAPRAGTVRVVAYQAAGAGHYIVLRDSGGNRDYVFMHLTTGSIRVRVGQGVATGQRLGDVGTTGASSGPHLHFEVWVGGWFDGGSPVDPLPLLKSWE
ncbi:MAG TPA: M23 family metallopeptidase [Thermoleophilaceae bacterium]|nr:M23 family metallopeptidase [Thermoleophilaceae bacterium]